MSLQPPILTLSGITAGYGQIPVLRDVSLEISPGEVVSLLGPNGGGKTTTMKTIMGLLPLDHGHIEVDGRKLRQIVPSWIVRQGIALVPEGRQVLGQLSVDENLRVGAHTVKSKRVSGRLADVYDLFPVLADKRRQPAGLLSGGQQQMLAISRALMAGPRLLLLDEPSLGLAPSVVNDLAVTLHRLKDAGTAMLLVEQNIGLATRLAYRAYILETGSVVAQGPLRALLDDEVLSTVYLGSQAEATSWTS